VTASPSRRVLCWIVLQDGAGGKISVGGNCSWKPDLDEDDLAKQASHHKGRTSGAAEVRLFAMYPSLISAGNVTPPYPAPHALPFPLNGGIILLFASKTGQIRQCCHPAWGTASTRRTTWHRPFCYDRSSVPRRMACPFLTFYPIVECPRRRRRQSASKAP
jgi:hypothetical protein